MILNKDDIISSLSITNIPSISAIYFALLQSGYDYYSFGRTKEQNEAIEVFYNPELFCNFFSAAKQNTCATYSYWPRAALLESAVFYTNADITGFVDFESYKKFIMSATNLQDTERNESFWSWVADFSTELREVVCSDSFKDYLLWENAWITQQNKENAQDLKTLEEIIRICTSYYDTKINKIKIVLSPIKCAFSSDYHFVDGQFIFSSGQFSIESVIHEFLHQIVHQHVCKNQNIILVNKKVFDCIDSSYYLFNSENGKLNAFEEYLVKELTRDFINKTPPDDLDKYIVSLLNEV